MRSAATITTRLESSSSKEEEEEEECSIVDDEDECMVRSGYVKSSSSSTAAGISKVYVAEIESLRQSFDSFERLDSIGKNMIRYNRRWGSNPARRRREEEEYSDQPTKNKKKKRRQQHKEKNPSTTVNTHVANLEYNRLVGEDDIVLVDTIRSSSSSSSQSGGVTDSGNSGGVGGGGTSSSRAFPLAGPRRHLHFDPAHVQAAVVTCGGLCPGLNNVIREIVHTLTYQYGVADTNIYGIVGGFRGFHQNIMDLEGEGEEDSEQKQGKKLFEPLKLTNDVVKDIHHDGGTLLRSARGGFDVDEIIDFLSTKKINQLYVIGGDGTHRAAYRIHQECSARKLNIAVAGIPKTIDNDIDYIDRSFGFQSSVEAAQLAIRTAKVEASSTVPNAVSVVKLMGRSAGFLASFAALGSGDVDAVLVPEVPIVLDGPSGILPFIRKRVKEQDHAVVVVAEGAGEELLGESSVKDKGGNKALPPIGEYMKEQIIQHFDEHGEEATVRYIDPSYTVRSVPANAADSLYCMQLAQNAVHGAMAGLTGFASGMMNNQPVYVPIPKLVSTSPRSMDPTGPTWEQILAMTGQPNTVEILLEDEGEEEEGVGDGNDADVIEEAPFPEPTLF